MRSYDPKVSIFRRPDAKLDRLAQSPIGCDRTHEQLRLLGAVGDPVTIPAGAMIQHEGRWVPWSYAILDGAALVSSSEEPIAVAGPGSWCIGRMPGRRPRALTASVTAATEVEALALCPRELRAALDGLPDLYRWLG